METIAEKLSEIEMTARSIVDGAQEQKHQMEMKMQKQRDTFDADMEKETNEKILKIQSDLATNKVHPKTITRLAQNDTGNVADRHMKQILSIYNGAGRTHNLPCKR